MKKILLLLIFSVINCYSFSQVVYEPVSNNAVYDFLDELATLRVISLNSVVKPYSRKFIAEKLVEAKKADQAANQQLSKRIRDEINFNLLDYSLEIQLLDRNHPAASFHQSIRTDPPGYSVTSGVIKAAVRPSFGTQFMASENGSAWEVTGGGEFFGYGGKLIGAYANVKQTWQSEALVTPDYFTMEEGKVWKSDGANNVTNTEWRGGISVAWKWGDFGVYKDRPVWGNAEHGSNILSGHAPSFPFISLHLKPAKWIEFQYIHGWLNSNVVDSSKSTFAMDNGTVGNDQLVYRKKYIAANMLTLTPWRGLDFSLGNSIIYSDENPNPWYLIPVLFYNSVDATKSDYVDYNGSNSQLFFDISSRQIRHLHLYLVLYVDEWKMSRALNKNQHNFTSLKGGFKLSDFPFRNATFTTEYTRTQPMTYDHYIPTTVFSSDSYILGNYLRENSQELFFSISFHPYRSLSFAASYTIAQHGQEAPYRLDAPYVLDQVPFLKNKTWQDHSFEFSARYEFVNKVSCFIRYMNSIHEGDVAYQPIFMHGKTNLFNAGVSVGF